MTIDAINGRQFDVAIIGGGINGSSAARHLSAAGYDVVLLEREDFGVGATSRSTRVLHCGLRFLETGEPLWRTLTKPVGLARAMESARRYMRMRDELARTMPSRVFPFRCYLPVYADDRFSSWQVSLALTALKALGPSGTPLDVGRVSPAQAAGHPLLRWLRRPEQLTAIHSFREYRHDWGERVAADNALDAKRLGAAVSNYTDVIGLARKADGSWRVTCRDALDPTQCGTLDARFVVNTAGPWIDLVNRLANPAARSRTIGTKGAHIVIRLPASCRDQGLVNIMRDGMPAYLVPWRQTHHYGPTDTPFDGDLNDIRASKADVDFLLDELNHVLPGAGITRKDIVGTWAGVRPWTNEAQSGRKRVMHTTLHDMADDGMGGAFALTGASITSHRASAAMIVEAIAKRRRPARAPQVLDDRLHSTVIPDGDPTPFSNRDPSITLGHLRHAARYEEVRRLGDLLMRRTGVDYAETKAPDAARRAAEEVAAILDWDEARVTEEVEHYRRMVDRLYGTPT